VEQQSSTASTLRGAAAIRVNITNHRSTFADFDTTVEAVVASGLSKSAGK
jgi:hypothetical protein